MLRSSLIIASLGVLAGCAANSGDSTIEIIRNVQPGEGCVSNVGGAVFKSGGIIDTNASSGYIFSPEVRSYVATSEDRSNLVFVEGANIELSFVGNIVTESEVATLAADNLTRYKQTFSGSIEPGGESGFLFEVLPWQLLNRLGTGLLDVGERVSINASVEIFGSLNGGEVISNVFTYPIDVCNGCLINILPDCAALPDGFVANTGGVCQLLQDGNVDCCVQDGANICPATPAQATEEQN